MTIHRLRHVGATDYTLPGPHDVLRMRYRFPQMFSTPEAEYNVLRPTGKNQGPQAQYLYDQGGPKHTPTQLRWVSGLGALAVNRQMHGLGALRWVNDPSTYGELKSRVRGIIGLLEEDPGKIVTLTDVRGESRQMTAAEAAAGLRAQFIDADGLPDENTVIPDDETRAATLKMLDDIEQQALPWYRKRIVGGSLLGLLALGSAGLSGYHGYRRNRGSWGWALVWGSLGLLFPIITPAVAFAQGYGKRRRR